MQADLIVYNGKVYTIDTENKIVEAFAITNGKIIDTGTSAEILKNHSSKEKLDVAGKPVYPGFIDPHCHFFWYAWSKAKVDLKSADSLEGIVEKLKHQSKSKAPNVPWIEGYGWDENNWKKNQLPDKTLLDKAFPDKPVFLKRIDNHAALVNQKALDIAGITPNTEIDGGKIEIKEGKPTGVLIESAIELVMKKIPSISKKDKLRFMGEAAQDCFSVGLTSVTDALMDQPEIELAKEVAQTEDWKLRLTGMIRPTEENKKLFFSTGPVKEPYLHLGAFKFFADGALGSRGACLSQPYEDDAENAGIYLLNEKNFKETAIKALKHDFQINTHCIGDAAVKKTLHLYGSCLKKTNDRRWRIEHVQIINPNDMPLFRHFSVVPSIQAVQGASDLPWIERRIGKHRLNMAFPIRELLEYSGIIVNGSDFPIEGISPVEGFYAAVSLKSKQGQILPQWKEHTIKREEALKAMTIWAAFANKEDDIKGSIEKGKYADFVVLDKDIMEIPLDEVPSAKVVGTYSAGERVY